MEENENELLLPDENQEFANEEIEIPVLIIEENANEVFRDKENKSLRSIHSRNKVLLLLKNFTGQDIDVIWIDFRGFYVKYVQMPKNSSVKLITYETHPWIALLSKTKDRVWINRDFVYMPKPYCHSGITAPVPSNINYRMCINITFPLHSLKYAALVKVRSFILNEEDVDLLQLPKLLKDNLKSMIKERKELPAMFINTL